MKIRVIDPRLRVGILFAILALAVFLIPSISFPIGCVALAGTGAYILRYRKDKISPSTEDAPFLLGYRLDDNAEIRLTHSEVCRNLLYVGTTGSGKSNALLGVCSNALASNSGFIFIEGKGDIHVSSMIYAMALRYGREADFLFVNGMHEGGKATSNTINPFASGSAESLANLIMSLLDDRNYGTWESRDMPAVMPVVFALMRALVWMRDERAIDLNVRLIIESLKPDALVALASGEKHPDMPSDIRESIHAFRLLDEHDESRVRLIDALERLASLYSRILSTSIADIDMTDVISNRRILVVLIPALEKSRDDAGALGKIVVADLKRAIKGLAHKPVEGAYENVVNVRPRPRIAPFSVIVDEISDFMISDMRVIASQSRSLNISIVCGVSDMNGIKSVRAGAGAFIDFINTKIIMRVGDSETAAMAMELAGVGEDVDLRARDTGLEGGHAKKRLGDFDRVTMRSLTNQDVCEMFVIDDKSVTRAKALVVDPFRHRNGRIRGYPWLLDSKASKFRLNRFVSLAPSP